MRYINEINEFYDWLETNSLPKSAISLWHALMHIANRARWPESFAVAISTIESKTGFKRSELFEARNVLQQKGRIEWKSRSGNQSAEYKINPFCVRYTDTEQGESASVRIADASADAKAYDSRTQTGTKADTIIRLDYTGEEKKNAQVRGEFSISDRGQPETDLPPDPPPSPEPIVPPAHAPIVEEVQAFFFQQGLPQLAEPFMNRNGATGWMMGGQPIINWRAAAAGYIRKSQTDTVKAAEKAEQKTEKDRQKEIQKNGAVKTAAELLEERRTKSQNRG